MLSPSAYHTLLCLYYNRISREKKLKYTEKRGFSAVGISVLKVTLLGEILQITIIYLIHVLYPSQESLCEALHQLLNDASPFASSLVGVAHLNSAEYLFIDVSRCSFN